MPSQTPDSAPLPSLPDITLAPTPLSRGPLAAVYKGWDRVRQRDVIVKVQRTVGDPIAAERFRREALVMGRLCHPNIVALYQFHDGDPAALVLEYVPGQTLADLVSADGWLSPDRAAHVIEEIAAALDCAHAQGVIHRDVKPSNILLSKRGMALLTDFGVAHIDDDAPLTVMGDILGTIEYASPEQVHGNETPDARSDVYSLAAVAYFALTATPPFRATDNSTQAQLSVMHRQVFAEPPPLRFHREDISPEVEHAVLRGLAKAPASRYPSAGQFAATLRAAVLRAGSASQAAEPRAAVAVFQRRGALAGALAAATLLSAGAFAFWEASRLARPSTEQGQQVAYKPAPTLRPSTIAKPVPVVKVIPPTPKPVIVASKPRLPKPLLAAALPVAKPAKHVQRTASVRPRAVRPRPIYAAPSSKPAPRLLASSSVREGTPRLPLRASLAPRPAPKPTAAILKTAAAAKPATAWLYVYANQNVAPLGSASRMMSIVPQSIWVDGYRASDLAAGHWTTLPAGRHSISFVPDPRSGFAPHKDVVVMLAPGARVSRQILLPVAPGVGTHVAVALPDPATLSKPAPAFIAWPGPSVGWYTVSGWVAVNASGHKPSLTRASADWVKVDGKPVLTLALGQWAQLTAGKHIVMFQPTAGIGVGPKTWEIDLAPQGHLSQQIPLPPLAVPAPPPAHVHLRNP